MSSTRGCNTVAPHTCVGRERRSDGGSSRERGNGREERRSCPRSGTRSAAKKSRLIPPAVSVPPAMRVARGAPERAGERQSDAQTRRRRGARDRGAKGPGRGSGGMTEREVKTSRLGVSC